MRNEKVGLLIRIIAGGYLIYLAVELIRGIITGENDSVALSICAGILFIVAGAAFIILSIRSMMRSSRESNEQSEAEAGSEVIAEQSGEEPADGEKITAAEVNEESSAAPAEEEEAEAAGEQAAFSEEKEEKEKE